MHLFDAHMAQLKASTEANRCGATDTLPHLQALRVVANDLEPAFGDLGEDTRFAKHASDLRAVLDSTLAAPPLNCTGVGAAMGKIGEACKACHQDFRSRSEEHTSELQSLMRTSYAVFCLKKKKKQNKKRHYYYILKIINSD